MAISGAERAASPLLFLDATILIKAASYPRLPYEVVRLGIRRDVRIALSSLVLSSARLHVTSKFPAQVELFERMLERIDFVQAPEPTYERVVSERGLCRDFSDVPIILAAVDVGADFLITNDRDLTVVDATTARLPELITVITPLAFLRHVLHWPEVRIEAAIHRSWHELTPLDTEELGPRQFG